MTSLAPSVDRVLARGVGWGLTMVSWLQRRIGWKPVQRSLSRLRRALTIIYVARLEDAGMSPRRPLPKSRRGRRSVWPSRTVTETPLADTGAGESASAW